MAKARCLPSARQAGRIRLHSTKNVYFASGSVLKFARRTLEPEPLRLLEIFMTWKPELDELARREAFARQMGGADKVKRQRDQGRLTVRERIDGLLRLWPRQGRWPHRGRRWR
jgi:hypothetical protein